MSKPLNELSATEAANAIANGSATSEALVAACLERIAASDDRILAWIALNRDAALVQARVLDRMPRRSRLHGVPVGIKDVIDTFDYPTQYNSPIYDDYQPKADAACVALLRRAGCVILGKTVTTEFANIQPAQTRNPWNLEHTPGGSSSGSAAAVADRMVPLSLGTQTAGSTIRPASYCGTFAIKPSFGSVSRTGVKPLAESLDTIGLFARSPDDLEAATEILTGRLPAASVDGPPRVGFCRTANWDKLDHAMQGALVAFTQSLERAGATVKDVEIATLDQLSADHSTIMGFESARALAWEYAAFPDKLSPALFQRLQAGWAVSRDQYDAVRSNAGRGREALRELFQTFDFLVTPSASGAAPLLATTGDSLFNRAWTLLGNPCLALPLKRAPNGLPLGVQLVGALENDMALIAWAKWARARHGADGSGMQDL